MEEERVRKKTRAISVNKEEEEEEEGMVFREIFPLFLLSICFCAFVAATARPGLNAFNSNDSVLVGVEFPDHQGFNSVSSSADTGCHLSRTKRTSAKLSEAAMPEEKEDEEDDADGYVVGGEEAHKGSLKLQLKHRSTTQRAQTGKKESVTEFTSRDLTRIHTLHRRIREKKNQNMLARLSAEKQPPPVLKQVSAPTGAPESITDDSTGSLVATLESGVTLGSGEYFMDVFVGTPPKHFSLILDTGSDLNWIQCLPCHDCFEQNGPFYNPQESSSFHDISCHDPRCQLVSSPDPPQPCKAENQSCPYFYWYGDLSNTTGDFAVETFTVNLTSPAGKSEFQKVENVMFGCGHWNRGLFHGAAGLLGLGRGPLSFSSQLRSLYGHTFSYCLVDRNSDMSVSSKLIFGEDKSLMSHPNLNFTSLVSGKENPVDTFYYIQIKSIMVGGEVLKIPEETWKLSSEGAGGTIIDSGTTLSYFADPAYQIIKEAFAEKVKGYPAVKDLPVLDLCYNVSGVEKLELPEFAILFGDGALWDFPVENYFIRLDPEEIVCLAILGAPPSSLSILGNYQQQNFHILYDTKKSRLGFAPMKCSDI
ncbi:aspartic proteinase nepenthesin-1-like [Macadamia integrifolia]|uniref:aspartic proteinase nepenthesin-1-like n=1 Tax=Macadamia integrifolia TaxID=60698 RepID=UPI001C52DE5C|nr:aspartic proteinase nepenthesin-1-like [Macadamia integrifolia]